MGSVGTGFSVPLDGVMEEPSWNDEITKFKAGELFSSDALLRGRLTYQPQSLPWPANLEGEGRV